MFQTTNQSMFIKTQQLSYCYHGVCKQLLHSFNHAESPQNQLNHHILLVNYISYTVSIRDHSY